MLEPEKITKIALKHFSDQFHFHDTRTMLVLFLSQKMITEVAPSRLPGARSDTSAFYNLK